MFHLGRGPRGHHHHHHHPRRFHRPPPRPFGPRRWRRPYYGGCGCLMPLLSAMGLALLALCWVLVI